MKKISPARLGLTFAGSFLGAGYVSGQELWQFFGRFGSGALPGLVLAMALIGIFGVMMLELSRRTGIVEMDRLVVQKEIPALRIAMSALQTVMLFGFVVIMCAGGSALCRQQWGISPVVAGVVFSVAAAAVSLMGLAGLVNVFSALVPLLSAVTVIVGIVVLVQTGGVGARVVPTETFGGWPVWAVVFFAYNTFGVIGVVIPLGPLAEDKRSIRRGVMIGCAILAAIALGALAAMSAVPGSENTEMPMLMVITEFFPWLAPVYAVLLILVMFSAALSCLVALLTFLEEKVPSLHTRRIPWTAAIMTAALLGSFVGFSDLVGIVYPIFGYCGFGFLALLALHYWNIRKAEKAAAE